MNKAAAKKTTTREVGGTKPGREGWLIAIALLDTSWRVALPILVLSYIGIQIDKSAGPKPLFTLVGFFLSLAVATWLVYRQINNKFPGFFKEIGK